MRFVVCFVLWVMACLAIAGENFGDVTVADVRSIYDGDSFKVDIAGWPDVVGKHIGVRVNGVDTPEMRAKCDAEKQLARKAKQFTVAALRGARVVELKNIQRGKYFRLVADVLVDGELLAEQLIAAGLGRPYFGGAKAGWCG